LSAGKILIVDDSKESRQLLSKILAGEGYDVRPADSGELALAAVAVSPPELILLDMRMPAMNGIEVCRCLKSRAQSRNIPIIFLSASLDFGDRLEGLEAGAVDFVNKPFRREELLARLKTHLELARLRKDLEHLVTERTRQLQTANEQLRSELERRRRIEEELRESEHRFRSLADTAPAIIFMADQKGLLTYVNQWGLRFTGRTLEQLAGNGYLDLVHPEDVPRALETVAARTRERRRYHIESRHRRFDGEYRWLAETGTPHFVHDQFAGHIGVMLDVTELKRSREQALANQKLESLGVLTAGIAHTFNNLMGTIVAHAELALDEIPGESPAQESVSTIAEVALRASEIVNLLMAYAGHSDSDTSEPIELSSLIQAIVQLLKASIPRVTLLIANLSENPTPVWANAGQIRQVVLNLIMNASEALEAQPGTVTVSTAKVRVNNGSVEAESPDLSEGDYVLFEVSDTGCGMTEETQARIFDPFFSTKFLGRGLGLASVQGIVRGAGGVISVVSSPRHGSTFKVWLPCWTGGLDQDGGVPCRRSNQAGTILLVDEEDELRSAAMSALQQEGFSVMATHDGLIAIDLLERHFRDIEAIVLDLTPPSLFGRALCDEIRRLKPDVHVLFTSAVGLAEPSALSNERFLRKPYRVSELIHTLREMMAPADAG
jgi:two-component system, cell cycle sensor histidine kinase and response regulator CckA